MIQHKLPPELYEEYLGFVADMPYNDSGKTYLELFLVKKGLLPSERQETLGGSYGRRLG